MQGIDIDKTCTTDAQFSGIPVFQYSSIPSIGCRVQRIDIEEMQCSGRKTAITVGCPPQSQWDSDDLIGGGVFLVLKFVCSTANNPNGIRIILLDDEFFSAKICLFNCKQSHLDSDDLIG